MSSEASCYQAAWYSANFSWPGSHSLGTLPYRPWYCSSGQRVWGVGVGWLGTWEWVISLSLSFPDWMMTFGPHHGCPGHLRETGSRGEATGEGGISG